MNQKATKNALETGRTFSTLMADVDLRQRLLEARNEEDFKSVLLKHTQELTHGHSLPSVCINADVSPNAPASDQQKNVSPHSFPPISSHFLPFSLLSLTKQLPLFLPLSSFTTITTTIMIAIV